MLNSQSGQVSDLNSAIDSIVDSDDQLKKLNIKKRFIAEAEENNNKRQKNKNDSLVCDEAIESDSDGEADQADIDRSYDNNTIAKLSSMNLN